MRSIVHALLLIQAVQGFWTFVPIKIIRKFRTNVKFEVEAVWVSFNDLNKENQ